MISNDQQLDQAMAQIARLYRALAALRRDVYPVSEQQFFVMAEGPLDEIKALEAAVNSYTGRQDAEHFLAGKA